MNLEEWRLAITLAGLGDSVVIERNVGSTGAGQVLRFEEREAEWNDLNEIYLEKRNQLFVGAFLWNLPSNRPCPCLLRTSFHLDTC